MTKDNKDGLCDEGQRLWDVITWRNPNDYRRHLVKCKECQRGLGLGRDGIRLIKKALEKEEKKNENI